MRNRSTTAAFAVAMAFVLCLGSACAKSGSAAPTKAQYVALGNSDCTTLHQQIINELATQNHQPFNIDTHDAFLLYTLIPTLKGLMQQLAAIPVPAGDGQYLSSIYTDYVYAMDIWSQFPDGTEADQARKNADARLGAYGLTACEQEAVIRPGDKPVLLPTTTTTVLPGT